MAFDDTFRHSSFIDESEVFSHIGIAKPVVELKPSNFEGPMQEWADERDTNFGDSIISRLVYVDKVGREDHRVAWVRHSGIDFENGESFCLHHIACDCILEADRDLDPDRIFSCEALLSVLNKRGWWVSTQYRFDEVLKYYKNPDVGDFEQSDDHHYFVTRSIAYILEHDYRHPEAWMGNIRSGCHLNSLMSVIMQKPPEVMRWYGEIMCQAGVIDFDGEIFVLEDSAIETATTDD